MNVAVVDTGVDLSHTGLVGHVVAGPDFIAGGSVTGDAYGHGTHVAGIIAANDSPSGGLGGAPGATILAVRVLDAERVRVEPTPSRRASSGPPRTGRRSST